jgi:broad specificity phosphatase PhoE
VAVVSHGGFYNDFLLNVFQLPWQETLWFRLYNTGITRIDYAEERVRITYLNRTDHLPPELLT